MDLINVDDLSQLSSARGGTRISLFLPTQRSGPRAAGNHIRLKNLLHRAEHALRGDGVPAAEVDAVLDPARQLLDRVRLWDQPSDGLAVFLGPNEFRYLRVPLRLQELATIGNRYLVRPLLPLLSANGSFTVLTLAQDEIRLFEGNSIELDEVALDGLPLAIWLSMPRRPAQVHAFVAGSGGTGGRALFHSIGEDGPKPRILQHFRRVNQGLRDVLRDEQAPLVLAGVRWVQALYRKANTHPGLLERGIDGSPRDLPPAALHRRAWALAEPVLRRAEATAVRQHQLARGTARTNSTIRDVLTAAQQGRVETLFLSTDGPAWRTRPDTLVRLGNGTGEGEQLDLAAAATLRHGGRVYAVSQSRMPGARQVAATLRY